MTMCKSLMYKASHTLMSLSLILLFLVMGCQHAPGHPPADGDTTAACDNNTPAGASWFSSEPQRAGEIFVSWFRSPMSTPQNPVIHIDVFAEAPIDLIGDSAQNPGHLTGDPGFFSNTQFTTLEENGINVTCGCDSLTGASIISGNTQADRTYDGTSAIETIPLSVLRYSVNTWIIIHCQRGSDDHSHQPVDFPISVLTQCQRPDGTEYEVETTLIYKTFSSCSHAQL